MKHLILVGLLFTTLISGNTEAGSKYSKTLKKTERVFRHIKVLRKRINDKEAWNLATALVKYSPRPHISVALTFQESSIRNIIGRKKNGQILDVGYFQITIAYLKRHNIKVSDVLNNLDLAAKIHSKILKDKIRICSYKRVMKKFDIPSKKEAWSCYHSVTPKYRTKYVRLVSRHAKGFVELR